MGLKNFKVVYPLNHDGKLYKKDDTVKLESSVAAYLVERGIIATVKDDPVPPNSGMDEPIVGEQKPVEGAAQQLTQDPGIPPEQG